MLNNIKNRLSSGILPYDARLVFIAIAIINLPGALFGGLFFWTVLPIPALIIYGFVVALAFGKGSVATARGTSSAAAIYHAILLALFFFQIYETWSYSSGEAVWARLGVITYIAGPMGLYLL
ncbi:MAG: hypothetical protein AAF927_27855, partial [Bacteroidota bacterium]